MKFQKGIKIFLNSKIIEDLKICVNNASPYEACGLIFGEITESKLPAGSEFQYNYIGKNFKCFESDKKSPVSFLIDNFEELNRVFKQAAEEFKLKLISIFHSHPAGSSPSGIDFNNMKFLDSCGLKSYRNQIWIIMDGSNYKINGFMYLNKELVEVSVELEKNKG